MRRPQKQRPLHRREYADLTATQREVAAEKAGYAGSLEHKRPGSRSDATLCPPDLTVDITVLTGWLQTALRKGHAGGIVEGEFPRYVWYRDGDRFFEGRLTNQALGQYKGYPIKREEAPEGL